MADPTVPWGIPLFDDNTPFAPIQAPFNSQSAALNDALTAGAFQPYATKALLDAAPGTRVGQHASVYADGTVAYNGDYRWSGSAWRQVFGDDSGSPFAMAAGRSQVVVPASSGASVTVTMPSGRFSVAPIITVSLGSDPEYMSSRTLSVYSKTATSFVAALSNSTVAQVTVDFEWTAVQMDTGAAAG